MSSIRSAAGPVEGEPSRQRRVQLARLAVAVVMALSVSPGAPVTSLAAAGPDDLQVVLASTQHWMGTNDVLLEVFDAAGEALGPRAVALDVTVTAPDGSVVRSETVIERFATYGRPLYRARLPFHQLGRWQVVARAAAAEGGLSGSAWLEVLPDMGTPPLGAVVPGAATPTMRGAGSLLHAFSSDPEPLSAFYISSVDDALANGQPLVFVLDSYAFRPNAACGGALGILHEIFIDYPALTIVHAEPWHMRYAAGELTLDPPGGPARLTEWSQAWGVSEPPWVFVVDPTGHLHAKFSGVLGSDELRAAIASVTTWRPPA